MHHPMKQIVLFQDHLENRTHTNVVHCRDCQQSSINESLTQKSSLSCWTNMFSIKIFIVVELNKDRKSSTSEVV
jgi:hypothetical protein